MSAKGLKKNKGDLSPFAILGERSESKDLQWSPAMGLHFSARARAAALCLLGLGQSSVFCAYLARAAYRDDPND